MNKKNSFLKINTNGNYEHDYQSLSDSITTLPTLRSNIVDLVQSVENTYETNIPVFVNKVRKDQSLVAQILKVARASKYSRMIQVDTISDAIQVLGVEKIRDIALTKSFVGNFLNSDPYKNGFDWKAFWKHANAVGIIASVIAKKLGKTDHERFYTAGLLHDLGKMGAFCLDEQRMLWVADFARNQNLSFIQAERELGTPRHDLLGHAICKNWDLPNYIMQVCRYHHTYSKIERKFNETDQINEYIDVVILANHLARNLDVGYSGHSKCEEPVQLILKNLDLQEAIMQKITPTIIAELKQGSFLDELLETA